VAAQELDAPVYEPIWFVRVSPRVLFNVRASISPTPTTFTPGVYDDGFVLPDIAGAGAASTWNWGYDSADQVSSGTHLILNRLTGAPELGFDGDGTADPSFGGELVVGAELARVTLGNREARLGIELGYAYHSVSISDRQTGATMATLTQDGYALNGIVPPLAPYAGTFNGPGPLISLGSDPGASQVINSAAQGSYDGELNSELHHFKAGVWLEYPFTDRFYGALSLGYSSLYADSRLEFTEQLDFTDPGIPDQLNSHTVSGRDWNPGFYTQIRFGYDFNKHFGVFAGAEFQYNSTHDFHGEGREVSLEFQALLSGTAGLVFRF
jgi:hypothetical protein